MFAGSTITAPASRKAARLASKTASTRGLNPQKFRATPIRAPRRPARSRKRAWPNVSAAPLVEAGIRVPLPSQGAGSGRRSGSAERSQQDRRVRDGARHRAGGVLAVGDRDDAGAADQPQRRLDAHDAVGVRRADDRAVGLGAHGGRAQVRRNRYPRARTRSARVTIQRVRVARLAAAAAPPADRMGRAEVRPLAEVGLAQDHRAASRSLARDGGILRGEVSRAAPGSRRWSASCRRCRCCL